MDLKTDVEHLPVRKQRELRRIVDVLHREFDEKTGQATSPERRMARILKIILFGSHARGDWVEDEKGGYFSDYDILIVVSHEDVTDFSAYWASVEDRLTRGKPVGCSPSFIVHTLHDVNSRLKEGQYFFTDIARDGILLYELTETKPSGHRKHKLAEPTPPDPQRAYEMAKEYFEEWANKAESALDVARYCLVRNDGKEKDDLNEAAFNLQQATERAYTAFFLTRTLYAPKDHHIGRLRNRAEDMDKNLRDAWPRGRKPFDRYFELLRRAYVEARYSKHYRITIEELRWLEERAAHLIDLVKASCKAHLATLKQAAGA